MDAILDYVLLHFYAAYQLPAHPFDIRYALDGKSPVQIRRGQVSFFEGSQAFPAAVQWQEWEGRLLPFFFDDPTEAPFLSYEKGQAIIQYDIIASAFYLLSGWQEFHSGHRDQFNRFPYKSSVQHHYAFITVPVVNYYFDVLKRAIEMAYQTTLTLKLWPGHAFATCLTHDIDRCESAWKIFSQKEFKKGRYTAAARLLWQKVLGRDAWFNLPDVLQVLDDHQAKATFLFLCHHQPYLGHPNADYDISAPRYQRLLPEIAHRGHEIGVHGSFESAASASRLQREAQKLNRPVRGNRFHYLSFDPQVTPQVLEEAGLDYDSTLGFPEHFGFRHAYCLPFHLFDFKNRRPFRFLEIPLNLMDVTLHHPNYLTLPPEEMLQAVTPMLQEIEKFRGCFTLLWHNENFVDHYFTGARGIFEQIISYASHRKTVFLTGSEVYEQVGKMHSRYHSHIWE